MKLFMIIAMLVVLVSCQSDEQDENKYGGANATGPLPGAASLKSDIEIEIGQTALSNILKRLVGSKLKTGQVSGRVDEFDVRLINDKLLLSLGMVQMSYKGSALGIKYSLKFDLKLKSEIRSGADGLNIKSEIRELKIHEKPFLIPASMIESEIKNALDELSPVDYHTSFENILEKNTVQIGDSTTIELPKLILPLSLSIVKIDIKGSKVVVTYRI